jgi:hypothetical protein
VDALTHQSIHVIASEAKQSSFLEMAQQKAGLLRRKRSSQ